MVTDSRGQGRIYEWKGKRVAVIGNGSSGIQCVANMHSQASRLVNYVAKPYLSGRELSFRMTKDGGNFAYTEEERAQFKNDPKKFFEFPKELETV